MHPGNTYLDDPEKHVNVRAGLCGRADEKDGNLVRSVG